MNLGMPVYERAPAENRGHNLLEKLAHFMGLAISVPTTMLLTERFGRTRNLGWA